MNRRCVVMVAGLAWLAGATASQAHHSFAAEHDRDRTITVTGVVQKLEWTNPHARIYVEGKDETGKLQLWDFELGPPNGLMRNGWNRNSLRQGHQVVVEGFVRRRRTRSRTHGWSSSQTDARCSRDRPSIQARRNRRR